MLSKFIFIIAIITGQGDVDISTYDVEVCPDVKAFYQVMEELRKKGEFINWNASCIERGVKGESING